MSQTHLFNTDGVACYLTTIGDTGVAGVTGMAGILRETSVITRASVTGVAGAAGYTGVTGVAGVNTWLITRVLTRASDTGVKTCSSAQRVTGAGVSTCCLTTLSGTGAAGLLITLSLVSAAAFRTGIAGGTGVAGL